MTDWAEEKAAAWLDMVLGPTGGVYHESCIASLAVLLREVRFDADRDALAELKLRKRAESALAEVCHVVTEVCGRWEYALDAGDEILSRLEKLS